MTSSSSGSHCATTFHQLNLSDPLIQAIENSGYTTPTPIQARTIPLLLAGRDVLGQAQTGTGKTAAFALPMLERLDAQQRTPQVLVLTPTRELAIQVADAFQRYGAHLPDLQVVPIYGGQDYQVQFRQLNRGPQVVVGTPGRVMDHMRRGSLKLDGLTCLVLDEADEMLRMGFADDVQWVLTQTPPQRQIALFSATMPAPIRQIAGQHLQDPAEVTIQQRTSTADTVRQRYVVAARHQKEAALARILEAEDTDGVMVFVKMKSTTEPLAEFLARSGHKTAALSGDVPQKQRERIVENLRSGRVDVIVATDVAARGLDVQRISHVINFDLPFDSEAYVHRIGRTGRAGRSGEAILFVHPKERRTLQRLERATGQRIEAMELPSSRDVNKRRVARFHERITAGLAHPDLEVFTSVLEQYRRDNDVTLEQIAAALAGMTQGKTPLLVSEELRSASFHEPSSRQDSRGPRNSFDHEGSRRPKNYRARGAVDTYRIEVGHAHQVKPGNIVGAIANEAGLESAFIGRIDIFDQFSTIDLPQGLPHELLHTLKNVFVAGRRLNISRMTEAPPRSAEGRPAGAPRGKHIGKKRTKQFARAK